MCVRHYKQNVIGTLPAAISIEFKNEINKENITDVKEFVEEITSKYFKDFSIEIDSYDEFSIDLDLEINLTGILEYIGAIREEPPEEDISWDEDYENLLSKLKKELKKVKNYNLVSIYEDNYDMDVYPAA